MQIDDSETNSWKRDAARHDSLEALSNTRRRKRMQVVESKRSDSAAERDPDEKAIALP
jgi:hypothetical protein